MSVEDDRPPEDGGERADPGLVHRYWRGPGDETNQPRAYLRGTERSLFLLEIIRKYAEPDARILEIGCNVGRNLNILLHGGYTRLAGVDINAGALMEMQRYFPELARRAAIFHAPIEEFLPEQPGNAVDVVYAMAVFEHIHTESDWVFPHIARITRRLLITLENEEDASWKHYPRNYRAVFEPLGFRQIAQPECNHIEGLEAPFVTRVLEKA